MWTAYGKWQLWWRWVGASAVGEMLGLGATFALGALIIPRLELQPGAAAVLLSFTVAVASGAVEATVVGLAQWWAMHPWFPAITRRAWWLATLVGALAAYVLGYLPSAVMSLGEQGSQAPPAEPPQWVVLLLAAGLGLVAGAVLSFAQWWVLRRATPRAGWWMPANMLAWTVGMPLVFWGVDVAQQAPNLAQGVLLFAGVLFVMGAIVGAIEGTVLICLVPRVRFRQ